MSTTGRGFTVSLDESGDYANVVKALQLGGVAPDIIAEASKTAGDLIVETAQAITPNRSGALRASIDYTVTEGVLEVTAGSASVAYARPMHVPYLSDGSVQYAKDDYTSGRAGSKPYTRGRRLLNNPFLFLAFDQCRDQVTAIYEDTLYSNIEA